MDNLLPLFSFLMGGLLIGYILGQYIYKKIILQKSKNQASIIIKEAQSESENIKKEKILQAKEKFLELKAEHKKKIINVEEKIKTAHHRIVEKEKYVSKLLDKNKQLTKELESKLINLDSKSKALKTKEEDIKRQQKTQIVELENISGLSSNSAKEKLIKALKEEAKMDAMAQIKFITDEATLTAQKEAKRIIVQTIQRIGVEESIENSVSTFNLQSDDFKGKIIGREGRNIRALEEATGVQILVDDTPEAIILSCFDPVRREIARLSLHRLVTDGRIHPARIEEVVTKTQNQINQEITEVGKRTVIDLGVHGLHPELVRIVGRMRYRSSYGQNLLQHSREVSKLCSVMASELGVNIKLAKRAGLLHDIGKVAEEESEYPHAILGMKWAEKYGENPEVLNAIGAHHDEIEMTSMISPIVQVCDGISGARPGARHQLADSYVQRLKDLEAIALGFDGVEKAYAIQAGRELRVIVSSDKVTDDMTSKISHEITKKIQKDMIYPGQVRVTVIRETRAVNVAK